MQKSRALSFKWMVCCFTCSFCSPPTIEEKNIHNLHLIHFQCTFYMAGRISLQRAEAKRKKFNNLILCGWKKKYIFKYIWIISGIKENGDGNKERIFNGPPKISSPNKRGEEFDQQPVRWPVLLISHGRHSLSSYDLIYIEILFN